MDEKELEIINQIPKIDKYKNINKGIQSLIDQLIIIQKEDLDLTFKDLALRVHNEILKNEKILKNFPKPCKSQKEFFDILHSPSFEKCKNLIEIKPEDIEKREECQRKITDLQKALNEISKINNNIIINDYEDELYEEEKQ